MRNLLNKAFFLSIIALAACSRNEKSEYFNVGENGWPYDFVAEFTPSPMSGDSSAVAAADIAVAVRHTNDYEFSNIWLELQYSNADTVVTDTFNMVLADVYGRWLGNGIGVGFQQVDTLVRKADIDMARPVRLRHIMRVDNLEGIEQTGIIVISEP